MIILFDLDGTLIDSTEAILESFHNSFAVYDFSSPDDEQIKALIGHPLDVMYRELGMKEDMIWDFVNTYKEHYRKISTQKTILLQNAKEAVESAAKFASLGIVTTKTGKYSQVLMEHFGLMDKFDVLIGREHVQNPKPHAEPILRALESFDTNNKEIWMIGDTQLDLISAKNAGINSIGVLSGYDKKETLKEFTNIIFRDSLDAVKYLESRKSSHY
ncbi:HAD family hydrolase [Sulfurimonas autotrophica]|uniref:phosphoglycolate phosphatase n=1 Tax=Sulfurimonas autotrophica (strain ATCC BAA-671 / DSM 16294 / JCM 11897 / OK10) TaxID=563040 RepID=E0UR30_SULAO|nr:HAD family hydrolase [Sulfurimonas autotrophica]ADN09986.1 HAD-superfamily hydrolase, subfamily IA, variant 1 [Sulfurimonas autotrophica DSM 16294]